MNPVMNLDVLIFSNYKEFVKGKNHHPTT